MSRHITCIGTGRRRGAWIGAILSLAALAPAGCSTGDAPAEPIEVTLHCPEITTPTRRDVPIDIAETHSGNKPYRIVATTGMVADAVRQVAGEHAEVVSVMGSGVDPHLYRPTRDDVKRLLEADVVFYSGLHLEGRMQRELEGAARGGKPVFAVTDSLQRDYLHQPAGYEGQYDPHVWMDARAWAVTVGFVADVLAAYDSARADDYHANAKRYRKELRELDEYARRVIGSVPQERRVLVTAHDAFGYFSCACGIPVAAVQGVSTESEASINEVNRLVDLLVSRTIPAIFVESSVSEKNMQALVRGAESRGHEVEIGGELYSDAMGPSGTYEGTYVGMIDHNATTIARALGGEAPKGGMQGKLKTHE